MHKRDAHESRHARKGVQATRCVSRHMCTGLQLLWASSTFHDQLHRHSLCHSGPAQLRIIKSKTVSLLLVKHQCLSP